MTQAFPQACPLVADLKLKENAVCSTKAIARVINVAGAVMLALMLARTIMIHLAHVTSNRTFLLAPRRERTDG